MTTANWVAASNWRATTYMAGDAVVFDDTATGTTTLSLTAANVIPDSVQFDNTNLVYTLQGPYGIAGSGPLAVTGGGPVTLATRIPTRSDDDQCGHARSGERQSGEQQHGHRRAEIGLISTPTAARLQASPCSGLSAAATSA